MMAQSNLILLGSKLFCRSQNSSKPQQIGVISGQIFQSKKMSEDWRGRLRTRQQTQVLLKQSTICTFSFPPMMESGQNLFRLQAYKSTMVKFLRTTTKSWLTKKLLSKAKTTSKATFLKALGGLISKTRQTQSMILVKSAVVSLMIFLQTKVEQLFYLTARLLMLPNCTPRFLLMNSSRLLLLQVWQLPVAMNFSRKKFQRVIDAFRITMNQQTLFFYSLNPWEMLVEPIQCRIPGAKFMSLLFYKSQRRMFQPLRMQTCLTPEPSSMTPSQAKLVQLMGLMSKRSDRMEELKQSLSCESEPLMENSCPSTEKFMVKTAPNIAVIIIIIKH